jgi:hypothetical protein
LVASIEYYKERVLIDTLNNELSEYKKILDNNSDEFLILDYLNKKKIELKPLDIEMVFDFGIELKPWYTNYLVTYGAPENGVFKSELMAEFVGKLIEGGVITLEEFINTL